MTRSDPHTAPHQTNSPNLAALAFQLDDMRRYVDRMPQDEACCCELRRRVAALQSTLEAQVDDSRPDGVEAYSDLTEREREVMRWIASGKSNWSIAAILGISRHTVDTHVRRAFQKLNANDRTTAAIRAVRLGIVDLAA